MAIAKKGVDIPPASEGRHIAQLMCVEETAIKSQYPTNDDGTADVLIWKFRSKTVNEETGEREVIRHMTAAVLTPNNNLTKFWKKIDKNFDFDECDGDTEPLEGKWFEIEVTHEKKGDKTYANIGFIKPYAKPADEKKGKK